MTDPLGVGPGPARPDAVATARQDEARDRSSRGLFSLVPVAVPDAASGTRLPAHPLTPDLAQIDPARLDVMFDPANLRRPVLRCVLDRVAAILDGIAVLQTPRMVVMDRAGDGDPVGVPLRPDVRPEDKDAVDRVLAFGGVTVLPARGSRPRRLLVAVRGCGELLGFLVATAGSDGPWPRAVASRAARTLALIMIVSSDALADRDLRVGELFDDLLSGRLDDRLPARAAALGQDLAVAHRAFAFAQDSTALSGGGDADPVALLVELVRAECRGLLPPSGQPLLGVAQDRVLLFLPSGVGRDPGTDPVRFAGQVVAAAAGRGMSVCAGIGDLCAVPADFAREAQHAVRVLEVLAATGRTGAVGAYEDLGVYGLLVHSDDHHRMDEFVRRWIGPLLDYDREHNADLVRTLATLLDTPTLAEAADALRVHTSTLKYRVKRIEEILAIPIRDPHSAFHLRLAATIHTVRAGIGRG